LLRLPLKDLTQEPHGILLLSFYAILRNKVAPQPVTLPKARNMPVPDRQNPQTVDPGQAQAELTFGLK
jgi:hypothetical protein